MRKISLFDMILVACANVFFTPIIVMLFPKILSVNVWWFVGLCIPSILIPFFILRIKSDEATNQQAQKFSFFEIQFAKLVGIFITLVLIKLYPQIIEVDLGWFIALCIFFAIRPFYVFWLKND